jgi:hypothetical protein
VLRSAVEVANMQLPLHPETKWLSQGRALSRFFELSKELTIFFTYEEYAIMLLF